MAPRRPAWEALDPPVRRNQPYCFDGVDGGALGNGTPELARGALDPGRLAGPVKERLGLLLRRLLEHNGIDAPLVDRVAARKLAGAAEARIREALEAGALG